jgi:segregation and condensation protein B
MLILESSRAMLFPLTGNGHLRNFPTRFFPEVAGSGLVHPAREDREMKRKGSNQERQYGSAQHHSEEWEEDPLNRSYDEESDDEPFEGEEEEDVDEDEDEDDLDEEDEEEEDEEEDDDL